MNFALKLPPFLAIKSPVETTRQNKDWILGLEVWQIFIVLTIILTAASSVMWFTNLQPESVKQEYLLMDKSKSEMFNEVEQVKWQMQQTNFAKPFSNQSTLACYSDVILEKADNSETASQVLASQQRIDRVSSNLKSNIGVLQASQILEFTKLGLDYSIESKIDLERGEIYIKNLQEIQQESVKLCQSSLSNQESIFNKLDGLGKNSISTSLDNGLSTDVANYLESSKKISNLVSENGLIQDVNKQEFINHLSKIITTRPTIKQLLNSSTKKYEEFMAKLKDLENWQRIYVSDKNSKTFSTVWVQAKK